MRPIFSKRAFRSRRAIFASAGLLYDSNEASKFVKEDSAFDNAVLSSVNSVTEFCALRASSIDVVRKLSNSFFSASSSAFELSSVRANSPEFRFEPSSSFLSVSLSVASLVEISTSRESSLAETVAVAPCAVSKEKSGGEKTDKNAAHKTADKRRAREKWQLELVPHRVLPIM
jgi:hypothetical protein